MSTKRRRVKLSPSKTVLRTETVTAIPQDTQGLLETESGGIATNPNQSILISTNIPPVSREAKGKLPERPPPESGNGTIKEILKRPGLLPPPFEVSRDPLSDENRHIPGDIVLDEQGKLLKEFIHTTGFCSDIINGYNAILQKDIGVRISQTAFELGKEVLNGVETGNFLIARAIAFKGDDFPRHNGELLLPVDAYNWGMSYLSPLTVRYGLYLRKPDSNKMEQVLGSDGKIVSTKRIEIGQIPVMLGAANSADSLAQTKAEREAIYEDPEDPLPAFIINGIEYLLLLQEKLRTNRMRVVVPKKKPETNLSAPPEIQAVNSKTVYQLEITVTTDIGHRVLTMKKDPATRIYQVTLPSFLGNDNPINILYLYRLLLKRNTENYIYSRDEIYNNILAFVPAAQRNKVRTELAVTIAKLEMTSDNDIVEEIAGMINEKIINHTEEEYATLEDKYVRETLGDLFPNIAPTNITGKIWMMSICLSRYIEVCTGIRPPSSRDNWDLKRLVSAGPTLFTLFSQIWDKVIVPQVREHLKKFVSPDITAMETAFGSSKLTDAFKLGFTKNKWKPARTAQGSKNVSERFDRGESRLQSLIHTQRIANPTKSKNSNSKIREIQYDQVPYVCVASSPEAEKTGLVKSKGITCRITEDVDPRELIALLKQSELISPKITSARQTMLVINAVPLGWCNSKNTYTQLKLWKQSKLYEQMCIVLDGTILTVSTDAGRLVAPFLVVNKGTGELVIEEKKMWGDRFDDLLRQGCIEYVDTWETSFSILAQSLLLFNTSRYIPKEKEAEHSLLQIRIANERIKDHPDLAKLRSLEDSSNALLSPKAKTNFDYCILDPTAIYGVAASIIPLSNHDYGVRLVFAGHMNAQGSSVYHGAYLHRMGTGRVLSYPMRPLVEPQFNSMVGLDSNPPGTVLRVMIGTFDEWTQEDAIVLNSATVDFEYLDTYVFIVHQVRLENIPGNEFNSYDKFIVPPNPKKGPEAYLNLFTEEGVPHVIKPGSPVEPGMCLVAKTRITTTNDGRTLPPTDRSLYAADDAYGVVDAVVAPPGANSVTIRIRQLRRPREGDKLASYHANKGVVARIERPENLPWSAVTGLTPDIIINPHFLPSRMNFGQILEMILGKISTATGERINGTAYRDYGIKINNVSDPKAGVEELKRVLVAHGFSSSGAELHHLGTTGVLMNRELMVGPCYYQVSKHNVEDKLQVRAKGEISALTRQPKSTKLYKGALRVGEDEQRAIVAFGASAMLRERLLLSSDAFTMIVCKKCGGNAVVNHLNREAYVCRNCGPAATGFGQTVIPYPFKLIKDRMAGAAIKMGIKFKATLPRLLEEAIERKKEE